MTGRIIAPGWSIGHWKCPKADLHTPHPAGYIEWSQWAEEKAKTHRQVRCPGCTRFAIWIPRDTERAA